MSKQKKKRNKKYTGPNAATTKPNITRVSAVSRSKSGQWIHERKKLLKTIGTAIVVIIFIAIIISGIISLF